MKKYYLAINKEEINELRYAYVGQVSGSDNLINYCERRKDEGVNCIMICESKKQAEHIVEEWNETYKSDGTYFGTYFLTS